MTTAITRQTELAYRASGGIDVYLFWNEPTRRVTVGVVDARSDISFEFEVDGRYALDAFNHPFAYVDRADPGTLPSHSESTRQETMDNPWRTEHARTDC